MSQAFSKNQTKRPQRKQAAILTLLTTVLVAVLIHFGLSRHTESAEAQTGDDGAATFNVAQKSPLDAMKELAQDPTRTLLRGTVEPDADSSAAPRDPFAIDGRWRDLLIKPEPSKATESAATPEAHPASHAPAVNTAAIKLQGIVVDSRHKYAIVNGRVVNVGSLVGNARIVDILDDRLMVVLASEPDSKPVAIMLNGR